MSPSRTASAAFVPTPAPDLDETHDPGPAAAFKRSERLPEDIAAEPLRTPGGGRIRIGTASWTDPTMTARGVFYPDQADTAEERLQYYASRFPIVEVDATYYALPSPRTAELWVERTPPDFTFDIKAHALMTGQPTETRRLPKDLRAALPAELAEKPRLYAKDLPEELRDQVWSWFVEGLAPLKDAGQLGSVLLQYPRWFFTSSENRDAIEEATSRLRDAGMRGAVEFRSASWFNEKNVDAPRLPGGDASAVEARGVQTVERFRYLYDRPELDEWGPKISRLAERASETHVLFNNCYANYGATNALELAQVLLDLEAARRDA